MNSIGLIGVPIVTVLLGLTAAWNGESTLATPIPQDTNTTHYKIVRAEYIDLSGNRPHTNTVCHCLNVGAEPVTITQVYILGDKGVHDILAVHSGLFGTVVPPMGRVDIPIDSSIPGVTPKTESTSPGVASVVIGWVGRSQAAGRLSATIERNATGDPDKRAHVSVEGYDVIL